jgi:hypothetical protein
MRIEDEDAGVVYVPFTGSNGQRGFRCVNKDGRECYIYLNPSGGSDDGEPTVFLYMGDTGEPENDTPQHYYVPDFEPVAD